MSKIPQPLSPGEECFMLHCKAYGLEPVRELRFHPTRQYRFDFAWPDKMLAVEIEGGTRRKQGSRHGYGDGFDADCRKYNAGTLLGWRILRYSTEMVTSAYAIDEVRKALA